MLKRYLLIAGLLLLPSIAAADQIFVSRSLTGALVTRSYVLTGDSDVNQNNNFSTGPMAVVGTFKNMYVYTSQDLPAGASYVITLRRNGASQAVTCTIGAGQRACSDTTHTFTNTAGDFMNYLVTVTGTPSATMYFTIGFTPTNSQEVAIQMTGSNNVNTVVQETYCGFGQCGAHTVTEAARKQIFTEGGLLDQAYSGFSSTPGGVATWLYTLKNNAATTSLACTINEPNFGCSDLVNSVTVAENDQLANSFTPTGSPTGGRAGVGLRFIPNMPGEFMLFTSGTSNQGTTGSTFLPISGGTAVDVVANGASSTEAVQPITITKLAVFLSAAPGATRSRTVTIVVNGVDRAVCTVADTAQTNVCPIFLMLNLGDMVYFRQDAINTPANGTITATLSAQVRSPGLLRVIQKLLIQTGGQLIIQ